MTAIYEQRKRARGWRAPENSICCTRPGRWGNPYRVVLRGNPNEPDWAVVVYDSQLTGCMSREDAVREAVRQYSLLPFDVEDLRKLDGKILLCWCQVGAVCHVQDVLIPLINGVSK